MAVDIPGVVSIGVFYLVILAIGIWASRKTGLKVKSLKVDDVMLANRSIGVVLGTFTLTATGVGAAYINGTAEYVANPYAGLIWTQGPLMYSISMVMGGFIFLDKMRSCGFKTILDPLHWKYGDIMSCLLYIPPLAGEIFWMSAILAALGASLRIVTDLDNVIAIIVSAGFALCYTLVGGLYSVAYTDVIQFFFMFFGLWLCVPYALTNANVASIAQDQGIAWRGTIEKPLIANWTDYSLLLIFGGFAWQEYWQRALAAKTLLTAKVFTVLGSFGCLIMGIPAVLVGAVAASTDWNSTGYGKPDILDADRPMTLPLVIKYLCPPAVTFIVLGAISAAVMSSTDSAILASSSMFSRNVFGVIYARIHKKKPSETLQVWMMRIAQVFITAAACVMALNVDSIYQLFVLCSDLVYVLLFPQTVCVLFLKKSNSYGSLSGYLVGFLIRFLGGEPPIGFPAAVRFPWYYEDPNDPKLDAQLFPFRTLAMLASMFTLISVSYLTHFLFVGGYLPSKLDIYGCFHSLNKKKDHPTPDSYEARDASANDLGKKEGPSDSDGKKVDNSVM